MRHTQLMSAAIALSTSLAASGTSSAVSTFIRDAAADGLAVQDLGNALPFQPSQFSALEQMFRDRVTT